MLNSRSKLAWVAASALTLLGHGAASASVIFSDNFSTATAGTYGQGQPIDSSFTVSTANVDVIDSSTFGCADDPTGTCVDLVGNYFYGGITTAGIFNLSPNYTYQVSFGSDLQGYSTSDTAETTFDVSLGSQTVLETLTAADGTQPFVVDFTPTVADPDAALSFTTVASADQVHGAVIDNVSVSATAISTAPEPSAWILMLAGVGGVGLMMRRTRTPQGVSMTNAAAI